MTAQPRALTPEDIPAAMRLKEAAGWNQTERDWRNLLQLAPQTCFGLDRDGALAATATAICYDRRLAWIGMVLTDPAHRRRGFARLLLEHTIEALIARQVDWMKLDATEMGVPLYRQLGFEPECAVERWASTDAQPPPAAQGDGWRDFCALDRHAFGADRSNLLALLAPMGAAAIGDQAYGMARSGSQAAYFGPCVSRDPQAVRQLLAWFLTRHPAEALYWDLLPHNREAADLAHSHGFQPMRRLVRMVRRGAAGAGHLGRDDSRVFAIAGFEFG